MCLCGGICLNENISKNFFTISREIMLPDTKKTQSNSVFFRSFKVKVKMKLNSSFLLPFLLIYRKQNALLPNGVRWVKLYKYSNGSNFKKI